MEYLKQSTAVTVIMPPMLDSADGNTPETALTISQADIRISKNGGAYAQTNNVAGATHMEYGKYSVSLDTTDTGTLGRLRIDIHETGALAVWREFMVVPTNVYDSKVLGTDKLEVDVVQLSNGAQSLLDLKDFADAGYDPATNKVNGVVLTDTTTTNTDMVGTNSAVLASTVGTAGAGLTDLGGMSSGMQGEVNNQVVDVIRTDTTSEMSQGAPPSAPTMEDMIAYIYFSLRNKNVETSTEHQVFDDAGTTILFKAAMDDSAGVLTKDEYISGV